MLYNRAVYDLTSIVKLVVDKVTPADRFQILALLKNIKNYLETCDVAAGLSFDDPLISVNNLISSIEDINISKNTVKGLQRPKGKELLNKLSSATAKPTLFSSPVAHSAPALPNLPVSRRAGVKRPPPPDSDENDNDDDDYDEQSDNDDVEDYYDVGSEQVDEVVIQDDGTEWQPIDMLERALTTIAKEQMKTSYVFDGNTSESPDGNMTSKELKLTNKNRKAVVPNGPKLYLPDEVEFANPTPRMVSKEGDRKWPENAKWICVYCRLITMSLKSYKAHLQIHHKEEDSCSCKYCRREFLNVELCTFHWCSKRHRCNVCHLVFDRPYRLRKHMAIHYKSYMVSVTCGLCETSFASATLCAVHVYEEHETIIMCDSCLAEFDPSESTADSPARLFCKKCSETVTEGEPEAIPGKVNTDIVVNKTNLRLFAERATLNPPNDQVESSPQKEDFQCDICDETIYGKYALKRHLATVKHTNAVKRKLGDECPQFTCDECRKIFINEESLKKHTRIHKSENDTSTFTCKICSKVLMTFGGYKSHTASHINARNFECTECSSAFNKRSHLEDHMDTYHRPDKWFPCSLCGEKFKNRKIRLKHVSMVHENFVYVCPHCENLEVRSGEQLRSHFAARHADQTWTKPLDYRRVSDKPYVPTPKVKRAKPKISRPNNVPRSSTELEAGKAYHCDVCNVAITNYTSVKKHLHSVGHIKRLAISKGEEPTEFHCDDCPKKFFSMANLDQHIARNHSEDARRYECTHSGCDRVFLTASGVREHRNIHTGNRSFTCDVCPASFFHKKTLDDHKACKHESRTYSCLRCDMEFPTRKLRTKHIDREHHNYIYYCTECEYATREAHCLRVHYASRHPTEKFTQPIDYRVVADKPYEPRISRSAAVRFFRMRSAKPKLNEESVEANEENEDSDRSDFLNHSIFDDEELTTKPPLVKKETKEKPCNEDGKSTSVVMATSKINKYAHFLVRSVSTPSSDFQTQSN